MKPQSLGTMPWKAGKLSLFDSKTSVSLLSMKLRKQTAFLIPSQHSQRSPDVVITPEQNYESTNDENLPNFQSSTNQNIDSFQQQSSITPLTPLPKDTHPSFIPVLEEKIKFCENNFSNSDEKSIEELQQTKINCLKDIASVYNRNDLPKTMTPQIQNKVFDMLYFNIFLQQLKPVNLIESSFYSISPVDENWSYLMYCYQILNKWILFNAFSNLLTPQVLKRALYLMSSSDSNIRLQLLTFVRSFIEKRIDFYHTILKEARDQLLNVIDGVIPPYSVSPILQILTLLFLKSNRKPPHVFYTVIRIAVLPLLKNTYYSTFAANFNTLITTIIQQINLPKLPPINSQAVFKDFSRSGSRLHQTASLDFSNAKLMRKNSNISNPSLLEQTNTPPIKKFSAHEVLEAIDKYWPRSSSAKRIPILETLFAVICAVDKNMSLSQFEKTCKFISGILENGSSKEKEFILKALTDHKNQHWIKYYQQIVSNCFFPLIYKMQKNSPDYIDADLIDEAYFTISNYYSKPASTNKIEKQAKKDRENEWLYLLICAKENHYTVNAHDFKKAVKQSSLDDPLQDHFCSSFHPDQKLINAAIFK